MTTKVDEVADLNARLANLSAEDREQLRADLAEQIADCARRRTEALGMSPADCVRADALEKRGRALEAVLDRVDVRAAN